MGTLVTTCVSNCLIAIQTWTKVRVGHVITLRYGDRVFLKALDVTDCVNFDALLASSERTDPHISNNLPRERTFVRRALAGKCKTMADVSCLPDNEPDKMIPIPQSDSPPLRPRHIVPRRRPLYHFSEKTSKSSEAVKIEPTDGEITIKEEIDFANTDGEDLWLGSQPARQPARKPARKRPLSPSSSSSSRRSPSPNPTFGLSANNPIDIDDSEEDDMSEVQWPTDFYAVDIVHGFDKCEKARCARAGVGKTFESIFQVPFRSTTYYNHRHHWESAPQRCRDKALAAGHTPDGLWTSFLRSSRPAEKKVAKRTKA